MYNKFGDSMNNKKIRNILWMIISFCLIILIYVNVINKKSENSNLKYIFLFIGDGMSTNQVELTEIYNSQINNKSINNQDILSFTTFSSTGIRKNNSLDNYITDSAASATALASGFLTYNGSINMTSDGEKIKPITYKLKNKGYKIGIITTVPLNHATPAAFYASTRNRSNYDDITNQLFSSNFDYFAGGNFIKSLVTEDEITTLANKNNYEIINTKNKLDNLEKNKKYVITSPYTNEALDFSIDDKKDFNFEIYVDKAIKVLDNEKGFFIMAESGLIDYAGHNNDAKSIIGEVNELDLGVKKALEFAKAHKNETLIIVTGDHETGGLTLGDDSMSLNVISLQSQKKSYQCLESYIQNICNDENKYEKIKNFILENYGINIETDIDVNNYIDNCNSIEIRKKVLSEINKNAKVNFSTTTHTADRIPVYAYGVKSEEFSGVYTTDQLNKKIQSLLGL